MSTSETSSSDSDDFVPIEDFEDAAAIADGSHFRYDPLATSESDSDSNASGSWEDSEDDREERVGNVEW